MRTKFFAIAAMVLGLASCQKDFAPEVNTGAEVDFQLSVSAPELGVTRAGDKGEIDKNSGMNSAFGAIDYLDGAVIGDDRDDWTDVDLRYSLEVYDATADFSKGDAKPIKDRQVRITDKYEPVTFELRLVPGRNYRFVVFADFVDQGTSEDDAIALQDGYGLRHTINGNLQNITFKEDKINDELADAYFKSFTFTPDNNTNNRTDATLTRPYAKVRVVATDFADLNLNIDPATVEVIYHQTHPTTFNAVTGEIGAFVQQESVPYSPEYRDGVSNKDLSNHFYTAGYDSIDEYWTLNAKGEKRHSHMTLFTDYILAKDDQEAISFKMIVKDAQGEEIKVTDFNTTIPVQRNHLTTIIGNVLTTATNVDIQINDNFANDDEGNSLERVLLETLINGGKFTLSTDMKLTAPHFLKGTIECRADAVIDLNGYTLTYEIPSDVTTEEANKYAIFVRVMENASLTFVGEGKVVSDGYIASVNEGGVLNVSEGIFESNSCTLFQSNGGEINIFGGEFKAAEYNGDHRYTVNFIDSKKQDGLIEISGGRFYKYNPEESLSENPAMNFCADGYWTVQDGDWYKVVPMKHFEDKGTYGEVYSSKGLLMWADKVKADRTYGLKLMTNIQMPAKTVAEVNGEYVFTDEDITVTDGVPSGSNWPALFAYENGIKISEGHKDDEAGYFNGIFDGNNKTISGLRILSTRQYGGGMFDVIDGAEKDATDANIRKGTKVCNLSFTDAVVAGNSYVGIVAGFSQDGAIIDNVKVFNSTITGNSNVGSIVGFQRHRSVQAPKNGGYPYDEYMAYIQNCSTDNTTVVKATGSNAGGICGNNYGSTIINCVNSADVYGNSSVGGVVGYHRDYYRAETDRNGILHDIADGYVIACCSTADATITATNSKVGGIVGDALADNSHTGTKAWIVACSSESNIKGDKKGGILGNMQQNTTVVGCWTNSAAVVGAGTNIVASYGSADQVDVDAMNAAIADYNANAPEIEHPICNAQWVLVGGQPVLQ